ncbi:MAG: hypothetical protein ACREX9_19340 [Gammaproteobacteria bacterium]
MIKNKSFFKLKSISRRAWLLTSGAAGACVFICATPILLWVAGSGVAASLICTPQEALAVAAASGLLVAGVFALGRAVPSTNCDCAHVPSTSNATDVPIACDLTVFTTSERAEHRTLGDALFANVKRIVDHSDGFTFLFERDAKLDEQIKSWLAKEKRCCPFFSFEITREHAPASLMLHISGPQGAKEILQSELETRGISARLPALARSQS